MSSRACRGATGSFEPSWHGQAAARRRTPRRALTFWRRERYFYEIRSRFSFGDAIFRKRPPRRRSDGAGQATLTKVEGAGGNGSGGKIEFVVNWVYSEDGGKVELSDNANASDNADRKGEASTYAIAGYLTFGLLGLFSHNMAHGKDAVISKDKVFHVFVDHDVHITTSQTDATAAGFDH